MTPLDAARDYLRLGWAFVPVPAGLKHPVLEDWHNRKFGIADLEPERSIAIRLGRRSGNTVDIDLDCREALELADLYLPRTGAEFGRASKPRSHRLYISMGATFEVFHDPLTDRKNTLLELRADGRDGGAHLTLAPPSVADGERREWCGPAIEPAVVNHRSLQCAMAWLAIGCLTLRYVSKHAARRPGPDLPRILWEFDHELGRAAYRWLGQPDPDAPRRYPRRRAEQNSHEIDLAELVDTIPNDCDWNNWNRIGMAIFAAAKDKGDGFVIFDNFSAKSASYNPHDVEERWRNYERSPPTRIGMGTLVHLARQAGWSPKT